MEFDALLRLNLEALYYYQQAVTGERDQAMLTELIAGVELILTRYSKDEAFRQRLLQATHEGAGRDAIATATAIKALLQLALKK